MGRLNSVQALRFFAALGVVLCHTGKGSLPIGAAGVDVFFVISGFIITRIGGTKPVGAFIRDRFTRIYPIYWLCSLPLVLVLASRGSLDVGRSLVSLTLLPFADLPPYLRPGWTLMFEVLFYACAALVIWRRSLLPMLLAAYGAALLAGLWLPGVRHYVGSPIILEFIAGALIAVCPWRRLGPLALLAGIAGLALAYPLGERLIGIGENLDAWRVLYAGVPGVLLVYGATRLDHHTVDWRVLPFLGDASYSIYLTHFYFTQLLDLHWAAEAVLSLCVGVAAHVLVERPALALARPDPMLDRGAAGVSI